jgi:hypothetical protein
MDIVLPRSFFDHAVPFHCLSLIRFDLRCSFFVGMTFRKEKIHRHGMTKV